MKHVPHGVKAGAILVVGADDGPGRVGGVGVKEHGFLGLGVRVPAAERFDVHGAEFPLLERVLRATEEPAQLLLAADGEPELEEPDAAADHHALELGSLAHELEILVRRAEAHDVLDAAAVVPGAVEENDFALGGKVLDVTLEIPLAALGVGRLGQRDDLGAARIEIFGEALDGAALAGGVAALEKHDDSFAGFLDPGLHFDQLDLQQFDLLEIIPLLHHLRIRIGAADDILFALGAFHFA